MFFSSVFQTAPPPAYRFPPIAHSIIRLVFSPFSLPARPRLSLHRMSSQARIRANPGNGNASRRFGTTVRSNSGGGASYQGGASSGSGGGASSSSRRYTTPASDRAGKRPSSRGGGHRNQRARSSYEQENDVDPIEDAVSLVEVCLCSMFAIECLGAFCVILALLLPFLNTQIQNPISSLVAMYSRGKATVTSEVP